MYDLLVPTELVGAILVCFNDEQGLGIGFVIAHLQLLLFSFLTPRLPGLLSRGIVSSARPTRRSVCLEVFDIVHKNTFTLILHSKHT